MKYRGFTIEVVEQEGGRKTYDTKTPSGEPLEWAAPSRAVAQAIIDAELEKIAEVAKVLAAQ